MSYPPLTPERAYELLVLQREWEAANPDRKKKKGAAKKGSKKSAPKKAAAADGEAKPKKAAAKKAAKKPAAKKSAAKKSAAKGKKGAVSAEAEDVEEPAKKPVVRKTTEVAPEV